MFSNRGNGFIKLINNVLKLVKIWDNSFKIVLELRDHSHAVTGLASVPGFGGHKNACIFEFIIGILSCSQDQTVRYRFFYHSIWNIETGDCLNK